MALSYSANISQMAGPNARGSFYDLVESNRSLLVPDFDKSDINTFIENTDQLRAYYWYFFIASAILVLPTVFGNLLIIVALLRYSRLRRVKAYILIGNLAFADLLIGLITLPMEMAILTNERYADSVVFCFMHISFLFTNIGASVVNMFVLSIERFHAVVYPFQHQQRFTKRRIYITIAIAWLCTAVFGFSPLYTTLPLVDSKTFECRAHEVIPKWYMLTFNAVVVGVIGTSTAFFVIIVQIARRIMKSTQNVDASFDRQRIRREIHHTRNMIIISGLFIVFWCPYCIVSLIPSNPRNVTWMLVRSWLSSLGIINCCLNWMVYGVRSATFRAAFLSIVTGKCARKHYQLPLVSTWMKNIVFPLISK